MILSLNMDILMYITPTKRWNAQRRNEQIMKIAPEKLFM
jgi:hypothetical protein